MKKNVVIILLSAALLLSLAYAFTTRAEGEKQRALAEENARIANENLKLAEEFRIKAEKSERAVAISHQVLADALASTERGKQQAEKSPK